VHVQPGCQPLAQTDSRQFDPALRQGGEREDQDPHEGDYHAGRDLAVQRVRERQQHDRVKEVQAVGDPPEELR
jgi:hypothetical protein